MPFLLTSEKSYLCLLFVGVDFPLCGSSLRTSPSSPHSRSSIRAVASGLPPLVALATSFFKNVIDLQQRRVQRSAEERRKRNEQFAQMLLSRWSDRGQRAAVRCSTRYLLRPMVPAQRQTAAP